MFDSLGTQFTVVKHEVVDGKEYVWVRVMQEDMPRIGILHESTAMAVQEGVVEEIGEGEFLVRMSV